MEAVAQVVSVIASVGMLVTYWLLSSGRLLASGVWYHVLILVTASFMGFASVVIFNLGAVLLNAAFVVLSAWSLVTRRSK